MKTGAINYSIKAQADYVLMQVFTSLKDWW